MKHKAVFKFKPFSKKQGKVLSWWMDGSPVADTDGIICDGAIRAGKTLCMSLSFCLWAMNNFNGENFAICGKTVGSCRRNVLFWLKIMLTNDGWICNDRRSENLLVISKGNVENYFYVFGGKDERSQDLIQGITLAGVFLDEVALMPESFVNQATGRCSVDGSKLWFNCNPEYPSHWFKTGWIDKADEKGLLYLHFVMDDNLSLSEAIKARYRRMYTGVWYDRFILGLWVMSQGLIYPNFQEAVSEPPKYDPRDPDTTPSQYGLSIDYGTQNAFAAILWAKYGTVWWAIKEYYYSGRDSGVQKTDAEYGDDLDAFVEEIAEGQRIETVIDPSAASFIALLRKKSRYKVRQANNAVLDGIRETATAMHEGKIKFSPALVHWRREIEGYIWDEKADDDHPVKVNDHAMDATRYWVKTKNLAAMKSAYRPIWN